LKVAEGPTTIEEILARPSFPDLPPILLKMEICRNLFFCQLVFHAKKLLPAQYADS
jgi:hypothetical protein